MPYLAFNLNDGNEFIFDLVEDRLSLGRDAGNEIVIDNSYISSFHAELVRQVDDSYEVTDLKSANGTFINGERIERGILKFGDRIRFGQLDARLRDSKLAGESTGQLTSNLLTTDQAVRSAIPVPGGNHLEHEKAKDAAEGDLVKLLAEIERKQQEFEALKARYAADEKEYADQVEWRRVQNELMQTLRSQEMEHEQSKLAELELRQSELQDAIASKSARMEGLTVRHDTLQDTIAQLSREESALKDGVAVLAASAEDLERTLADARAELEKLAHVRMDEAAANESLHQAVSRREEEESRAALLASENAGAQKLLEQLRDRQTLLLAELSDQESQRQNLMEQIDAEQVRLESAVAASKSAEEKLAEFHADLQSREGIASSQIEELSRKVDDLRREEDGLSASLQAGRERLQKTEAAYQDLEKKLADKELAYSQFTHSGDKLLSLSEALSHMESREQEVSRHLQEVAEQELSTQVKLNSLDEEIERERQRLEQVRREREHEERAQRHMMESRAKELEEARHLLAEQMKREESALALRMKERVQELEEKHETLRLNLSTSVDENTVILFASDLIKRIDLVDILVQRFSGSGTNAALEQQLHTLRASLEDILEQHGISEFTVAPGAEVDVDLRLRITIVESIPGPGRPTVVECYRPGFIYAAGNGREVILRKVEVKTSSA